VNRDRYLDALRAVAIVRVIVFHMFGWAWLSLALPAMGVMFALGGSLMAASMARSPSRAIQSRVRRLLPALWVMGAILVPAMLWAGWPGLNPAQLVLWVVPIADPPGTEWAQNATDVLWYLVTYLWLVLLSPFAWRLYRRLPVVAVLLPLAVLAFTRLGPYEVDGRVGDVLVNVACFAPCWIAGFAHRQGALRRAGVTVAGVVLLASGAAVAVSEGRLDLNELPLAQGLYSLGFVLLVLRLRPKCEWVDRVKLVGFLNARAVTVYLWHNVAIGLSFVIGDALLVWEAGQAGYLAVALALTLVIVLALGWVEDLAAGRRPALFPVRSRSRGEPVAHAAHRVDE
jgi:peptidoglycan/LPS O-acetylase OafA/YrhL